MIVDVLKLGFIYFAVFVLLGSEKHVHIDMRYLKLAEDLEDFGKYPWGAVCYAKTNASLLRALCADYQRVKVPTKTAKTKKTGKKPTTTATALAALHLVMHEDNAYIPRLLHWRSNSSPRFYELMSQVFENREVDVQLLRPSVMDKQQPYWTWGDSADDTEELVDLLGDDVEQKTGTSASVEEKDKDIDETASLPSSSKASITFLEDILASRELRTLKRDFEEVKQKGLTMSISNFPTYWPHSTSCGILIVKFIEHLSAGISVDKVDPLNIKYYRLKLAIEGLRGRHIYEGILAPSDVRMGLKFSDLMYVTKRSMNTAVSKFHKLLESMTEAIASLQSFNSKFLA
ncbi:hypothetical protein Prudu_862S000300 [Prunus dulcis]|uniref:DUF1985 domain-containing protein n=1 Tax=Prunus dulcis TaxID=3755 RepID=A0A5H2Y4M6_PRUDU|nr:hypothetical protein Prudu_862S000300 [Prunus dulcis]